MARKILLADDSVTAQNMGRKILADAGYEVITVNNGSAALKKIAEVKPDLIVLDVYMPGYSGLEVCQRLKEVQETSRIPILLTVGKLEPFKPEEAKRVRAEGYIVKPFEASELLSALAKLEDKIVPRGESSKPGRFARANAALDEGRYDKSVAIEEDSGWKNRIAFPSKKKDKAVEEDEGNEVATYNPVNKDLPTVVEAKPASTPQELKDEEDRVNLTALAPEGLPRDVTPEEIAALAAAAAQVKGKIADAAEPTPAPTPVASEKPQQEQQHEEVKHEAQPAAELPKEAPVPEAVTFASEKAEEKTQDLKSDEAAATADAVASIAASESVAASSHTVEHPADEPVTMAAAAGVGSAGSSSRWTAVSVAVAADEAAISLEQEMQKAYAAFAAAETAHSELVASVPQAQTAVEPTPVGAPAAVEQAVAEPVVPKEETPAPEVSQAMSAMAHAATDAISAAVKELEAVAASYSDVHPQISPESAPAPVEPERATPTAWEAPQPVEAKAEETPVVPVSAPESIATQENSETLEEARHEEQKIEGQKVEEQQFEPQQFEEHKVEEATAEEVKTEVKSDVPESTPVAAVEPSGSHVSTDHVSTDHAEPPAQTPPIAGEDIAATTAAAWASWRRVRESGSTKSESAPQDAAAMAVAAGAESSPEGASDDSNPAEIANIVDSVLADLRPKIFEEISRKMKKK